MQISQSGGPDSVPAAEPDHGPADRGPEAVGSPPQLHAKVEAGPSVHPRPGDIVRLRRQRWRVVDVSHYDDCQLLTLTGAGAPNVGVERRVLAPFDTPEPIDRPARLRLVRATRWRRACRTVLANHAPPGGLRAARHAGIDLLPHQLEPALAVLRGLGSRVLLADDVGLGKTIQAGLIVAELVERRAIERTLVLTPAGLREQWVSELAHRFALDAVVVDMRDVRRRVDMLPVGVNPWATIPVAVASIDYVKRPEVLPAVASCRWDVLIVDEAHGVAGTTDRHAAVAALAERAGFVLLLSATPHSGDRLQFRSLCGLGAHGDEPLLVFRRTRREVRLGCGRRVHRLHVRPNPAELRMHTLLASFTHAVRQDHAAAPADAWLALAVLHKRALSSARSLEQSIEHRLRSLAADATAAASIEQLVLPLSDPGGDFDRADAVPAWSPHLSLRDTTRERDMLAALALAARAAARRETKMAAVARLLNRLAEPAIVFTEYRDTLVHLRDSLARPASLLHGGLTRAERAAALADFTSGRRALLLATDAAAEGLNLHRTCRVVINLELPWNPMRLEQRIGRVDRIGQRRTVHAFHLVARDTGETRILEQLTVRIARARADIGAADPLGTLSTGDEETIARLVIDGASAPPATGAEPASVDIIPTTSMGGHGRSEADRLTAARRLLRAGEDQLVSGLDAAGPWLTIARTPTTRRRLGASVLLIARTACEDACGRTIDSTTTPLAVRLSRHQPRCGGRGWLEDLLTSLHPHLATLVATATAPWRDEAMRINRAFAGMRLARERAIATSECSRTHRGYQPGLFDRRAERGADDGQALQVSLARDAALRIATIERGAEISVRPAELLLVMAP